MGVWNQNLNWIGYLNFNFFAETHGWWSSSVTRHQQRGFHDFFLCDTWGHWGVSSGDQWDTWGKNPSCTRVRALWTSDCPWWSQRNGVHAEPGNESFEAHNEDLCMFSHLDSSCPELITTHVKTLICPLENLKWVSFWPQGDLFWWEKPNRSIPVDGCHWHPNDIYHWLSSNSC